MRQTVVQIVDRLLGEATERGAMDLVTEFAFPLPAIVIAGLRWASGLPKRFAVKIPQSTAKAQPVVMTIHPAPSALVRLRTQAATTPSPSSIIMKVPANSPSNVFSANPGTTPTRIQPPAIDAGQRISKTEWLVTTDGTPAESVYSTYVSAHPKRLGWRSTSSIVAS
jgi:hypothetical protein